MKDSIKAFENEMMVENKLYIDNNGNLKKRKKCKKEDYCILKIPYTEDGRFYEFEFDGQSKESIYSISIAHKGKYNFKKASVVEFPKNKKMNIITKTAIVAITTGIILCSYNSYSASWLDANNYDISWYADASVKSYNIATPEQMAGLAHLVNEENVSFEGKNISCSAEIDLTGNEWKTLSDIFKGNICGAHRILLNGMDNILFANKEIDKVEYVYSVKKDNSDDIEKVSVAKPYTIEKLKEKTGARYVFLNNKKLENDTTLTSLNLTKNDVIQIFTGMYINVEEFDGEKNLIGCESGDSVEKIKEIASKKINIPLDKIVLKYKDKELKDERFLCDYNIQREETIKIYKKINIKSSVEKGEGTVQTSESEALSGDEITVTFNSDEKYELESVLVNGGNLIGNVKNNSLKLDCKYDDLDIKVSYKLTEEDSEDEVNNNTTDSESETENQIIQNNIQGENPTTNDGIIKFIRMFTLSMIGILINRFKRKLI